jgi:hypothetical protein
VREFVSGIPEERCHDQFRAICADFKEVKMNVKGSAKQEDESSPQCLLRFPIWHPPFPLFLPPEGCC